MRGKAGTWERAWAASCRSEDGASTGRLRSVPGKNSGEGISQQESDHRHGAGSRSQVIPYVAFNVNFLAHGLAQFHHRTVQLVALVGSAFFQHVYGESLSHTVL